MRRVVVNMHNFIFTDAIGQALKNSAELDVRSVDDPGAILEMCKLVLPYAVIMEVTRFAPYTFEERIKISGRLATSNPECKVLLICDEKADEEIASKVKQAKIDGLINQFIYGSISATYMTALIDSL